MSAGGAVIAQQAAELIKERFQTKGAISPATALTLEDLDLHRKPVFELMMLHHQIIEVDGKYWCDVDKVDNRAVVKLHEFIVDLIDEVTGK